MKKVKRTDICGDCMIPTPKKNLELLKRKLKEEKDNLFLCLETEYNPFVLKDLNPKVAQKIRFSSQEALEKIYERICKNSRMFSKTENNVGNIEIETDIISNNVQQLRDICFEIEEDESLKEDPNVIEKIRICCSNVSAASDEVLYSTQTDPLLLEKTIQHRIKH